MRNLHIFCCYVLLSVLCLSPVFGQAQTSGAKKGIVKIKVSDEWTETIGLTPKVQKGVVKTGIPALDAIHQQVKAVSMQRVFPYAPKFEEKARKHGLHQWYEIRFENPVTPENAVLLYKGVKGIITAEVLRTVNVGLPKVVASEKPAPSTRAGAPFNDPLLSAQWHYHNDGSSTQGAVAGSDINLYEAWKVTTGTPNVIVAIIDGGIDYKHRDLAPNMWVNETELNGQEGVDDDGNGFTDDIYGYNFVDDNGNVTPGDHGTHVAGTVAAVNNNGIGVGGVAGGSGNGDGVRLMSCQTFDGDGDFAKAFYYAAINGAVIAQCSWGWPTAGIKEQSVLDAVDYFAKEAGNYPGSPMKGGICIFACGNQGEEGEFYPAAHEPAVAVAAMGNNFKITAYSNSGPWVDIVAPGGLMETGAETGVYSTLPNDKYGYMQGTSQACPHVSGIAALILSKYGNESYTPEMLRNRLVTAIHDIYQYNPDKVGKAGAGYIDAVLALKEDQGKAPQAITDFAVYAGQNTMTAEWTIPQDEDDGRVQKHILYYSEQEFNAQTDLSTLKHQEYDTKFRETGEKITYEFSGFKSETDYWLALQAVDRWGNASPLTEIQHKKTNKGPEIQLDKEKLAITLNTAEAENAEDHLNLTNIGEGLLKWTGKINTVNTVVPSSKSVLKADRPQLASVQKRPVQLSVSNYVMTKTIPAEYVAEEYPKSITYYFIEDVNYPAKFIGETDTTKSNSLAQWFIIDEDAYPDGFNLTSMSMIGKKQAGRTILEVYRGEGNITPENLLCSDTLGTSNDIYGKVIKLSKQLYFGPGESFWIVVHVEGGNRNPLGAGYALQPIYNKYSYYSSDMGKSWTLLKDILTEGSIAQEAEMLCWGVAVVSSNPNWGQLITLDPAEGSVRPTESSDLRLYTNGTGLINGSYNLALDLNSNDPKKEQLRIPLKVEVSGQKPDLHSAKIVEFGKLFINETKDLNIEIFNAGYGRFTGKWGGPQVTSSDNKNFSVASIGSGGFPARQTSIIKITYKPKTAGTHASTITLTDQYGTAYKIQVTGTAVSPAVIAVNPAEVDGGDLAYGGTPQQVTFQITNNGQYPLEYVMPKFSDAEITGLKATSHRFGYSWASSIEDYELYDKLYETVPFSDHPLVNPIDIKDQFGPQEYWSEAIDLGFAFPFYGEKYDSIYVSNMGALSVTGNAGAFHASFPPEASDAKGVGLISAVGSLKLEFDEESHVYCGKQNGKFVISYENAKALNGEDYIRTTGEKYTYVSFRIFLSSNGDIEFVYENFPTFDMRGYSIERLNRPDALYMGIVDINVKDAMTIYDYHQFEPDRWTYNLGAPTYLKISAPQPNMITKVEAPYGTVNIGETETITLTLEADTTMYKGALKNILTILSNDPKTSTSYVVVNANITGDYYKPAVSVNPVSVDYGEVYKGAERSEIITISNKGKATATIQSITLEHNKFSLPYDLPAQIEAGCSYDLMVSCKTETLGEASDVLHITLADQTFDIPLKTNIIKAPGISINPASRTMTMNSGDAQTVTYAIRNTGENTLTYAVKSQKNFYPVEPETTGVEMTYISTNSVDKPGSVDFEWIDITQTGEHVDFDYLQEHDFKAVDLPFAFPFYGKKYTKAYICMSGFITFTEYEDLNNLPTPVESIPSTEHQYKNFLAPYWGNHSPAETKEAGIYYQTIGDHFVISYVDYANSDNLGVCFQAILYPDGSVKYQYTLIEPYGEFKASYGITGLENEDGTQGLMLPNRSITMNEASMIWPVITHKLEPQQTASVEMKIATQGLLAGQYALKAPVITNVPRQEETQLGLNLTVTGTPIPVATPQNIDLGDVILEYLNTQEGSEETFKRTIFTISNNGTAAFKITNITYRSFNMMMPGASDFLLQYSKGIYEGQDLWDYYMPKAETGEEGGDGGNDDGGFTPPAGGGGNDGTDDDFGRPMPLEDDDFGQGGGIQEDGSFYIAKGTQRFAIAINNTYELMEVKDTLVFHTDAGIIFKVPVRYNLVESPEANLQQEDYRIYAPTEEFIHDSMFTLSNSGHYPLTYDITVEYNNILSSQSASTASAAAPVAAASSKSVPEGVFTANHTPQTRADEDQTGDEQYPVGSEYRRNLSYPWGKYIGLIGTGDKYSPFVASTKFKAPADGFNISAIQYVGSMGAIEEGVIRAEIRNGSESYLSSQVIAEGEIKVQGPEMEDEQHLIKNLRTIEFKNPVYLNPNETFYVFLYFPAGTPSVLSITAVTETKVTDRYHARLANNEWIDLASLEAKYGPLGYTVRCLEKVEGEPWISIKGNVEGTLEPDAGTELTVHVNALQARQTKNNKARVLVSTNDPLNPQKSFYVTLDKNGAPIITVPDEKWSVKEEATGTIRFHIEDLEGDTFRTEIQDELGIATLTEDTLITLSPKFGHTGSHTLTIVATDQYDNEATREVAYYVEKVNQKPVVVQPLENLSINLGDIPEAIDLTPVFSDPDEDELTYIVSSDDEAIVIGVLKNNQLELIIKGTGTAEITVTAADPAALAASTSFKVTISEAQNGISQKEIEAYPNPVVYTLNIRCPKDLSGEGIIRIYGSDGSLYYTEKATLEAGVLKTVDMTNWTSGVYILEIETKYEKLNTKVIKQ